MVRDDIDIDALIAEHVMDWKCTNRDCDGKFLTRCGACGRHGHGNCYGNGDGAIQISCIDRGHRPSYSSDIKAAWEVVEKLMGTRVAHFCGSLKDGWDVWIPRINDGSGPGVTREASLPLAICLAALKVVGVEVPA